MITTILLVVSLFVFLFSFYAFTKDDFFFIRKGITMENLFNVLFLGLFFSIFSARLFYVLLHLAPKYINPIVFFVIPYFPGISLFGGLIGLYLAYAWLTRRKKMLTMRFLDYVSLSLICAFPFFFIAVFGDIYQSVMYIVLFFFFQNLLLPKYNKGMLREGSITYIFLIMVSFVSVLQDVLLLYSKHVLLEKETFLFGVLFFITSFLLIRVETRKAPKTT